MSGEIQDLVKALRDGAVVDVRTVGPGELTERPLPTGWSVNVVDGERWLANPRRPKGDVKVRSAKGFIDAVKQRSAIGVDPVALYADDASQTLVAILNDDGQEIAGWRDHRVHLEVRKTPEWIYWRDHEGLRAQEEFAEAIEEGQLEIQDPPPAVMLRIAETFEATVGVQFRKGTSVRDGAAAYVYEETIDAKAGKQGQQIEIPEGFTIAVAPFIGSSRYSVKARLKTRLNGGKLSIGYTLERPDEIERAAFKDIATQVAEGLGLVAIEGVAPAART